MGEPIGDTRTSPRERVSVAAPGLHRGFPVSGGEDMKDSGDGGRRLAGGDEQAGESKGDLSGESKGEGGKPLWVGMV